MKRLIFVCLLLSVTLTGLFASVPVVRYDDIDFSFRPTQTRFNAMGQASLSSPTRTEAMFVNPALLAERGFSLNIPSLTITLYNVHANASDQGVRDDIKAVFKGNADSTTYVDLLQRVAGHLGTGYNLVSSIDTGIGFKIGQFAFGTDIQVREHSLRNGNSILATTIIPELNVSGSLGFGFDVVRTGTAKLSIGISAHAVIKQYYKGMPVSAISDIILSDNTIQTMLWDEPVMGGYAFPIDIGLNFDAGDSFRFSVTANNLNGKYRMKSCSSLGDSLERYKINLPEKPEGHSPEEGEDFMIETPWELNAGFSIKGGSFLHPTVAVSVVDMISLVDEIKDQKAGKENILLHLNAGLELDLFEFLSIKGGINRGYLSAGAGINLPGLRIDASYGWQEFGKMIGDKPVDALSVRVNIGYDK